MEAGGFGKRAQAQVNRAQNSVVDLIGKGYLGAIGGQELGAIAGQPQPGQGQVEGIARPPDYESPFFDMLVISKKSGELSYLQYLQGFMFLND